ncbi:phytoene/squalene synthase family protein [Bosea sp. AAP35]|uniref:phytoene/squalene synthase family protein n=1 Tax=Bosea sp. AAP35 TaxID=1523417 RepID=UPI0006B9A610|nr:phytoene/squalene synthase family protein [Bosea sp. AAP35]
MRFSGPSGTDLAACDAILRVGSKSFRAAALLLPRDIRQPATALYAFCRLADDAIDEGPGDATTIALLERRVAAAHAGRPHDHPVDRAFSETVRGFGLPPAVTLALIEGLAWDAQGRRYESFDDLCDYAARVAGSVGVMMATLMDRRAPEVLARAADLGVAMQLSNIARDVGADAAMGRIYLPLSWLREAGIDPDAFLADPRFSPALGQVVARLLAEADRLYARADAGIAALPASCRSGIRAARSIYAEIGREVARRGHDGVSRRAVVPAWRKLVLLARALAGGSRDAVQLGLPAMPATAYLVTAVAVMSQGARMPLHVAVVPWWDLVGRTTAVIEMFERLGRVERSAAGGR